MFLNSYADPAGLTPMKSPSLPSFCHPNLSEYQDLSCPVPTLNNQINPYSFEESVPLQSLFSTPPPYYQSSSISPRLTNGSFESIEFAPPSSQMALRNLPGGSNMLCSFLPPIGGGQYMGNEISYLDPQNSMPILNLQTPPTYFLSDISEVPLLQDPEAWPIEQATAPETNSERKTSTSKRAKSLSTSSSATLVGSPSSKSDHTPRARKTGRSSHLILTDSHVSVTQGGYARKYACTWEGCGKAFTTSGHLVRHKRIHTGERLYKCVMESCTSRFSRQDNMLQHYRTHFSSKSRRIPTAASVTRPNSRKISDPSTISNTSLAVPQLDFGQFFAGQNSF